MKKLIIIAFVISLLLPTTAGADVISYKEAWAFLYDFPLAWDGNALALQQQNQLESAQYHLTTGDAPVLPVGNWTLTLFDGKGRILAQHQFDPVVLATAGRLHLLVPYFDNGTTARFSDASGQRAFDVDLRGSRVCNDDDYCASGYGEDQETCPSDCGSVALTTNEAGTATIAQQVPMGQSLGLWILRLSLGIAGMMLLMGVARMLDSRSAS